MKRREFVTGIGAGAIATMAAGACSRDEGRTGDAAAPAFRADWKMVTTWPPGFPGLGTGAQRLADRITEMSGGRLTVRLYAGGELVPAFEAFDAVSRGTAQLGHGAAYYWKGKTAASQFFAAVPFGMNAQEVNAWLYYGGGLELWREVYAPFGIIPAPAGNSGVQMGGWFNREINSVDDLNELKMRIPGLGGDVLRMAGGTPVNTPGSEIFTSLQTGNIDATEWVGPYNDLAFGLHKAAKYYYYPGWHEPGSTLECLINADAYNGLPADLKAIVMNACQAITMDMLSEFTARNNAALKTLVDEHGVKLRAFPPDVLTKLRELSEQAVSAIAAADPLSARVLASYQTFARQVRSWHDVSERAWFNMR